MFIYKTLYINYRTIIDLNEKLAEIGKKGWEIISYNDNSNPVKVLVKIEM